jgi:valyl-tRNA synthetase
MTQKMSKLLRENEQNFKEYRLSEALMNCYSFVWDDFCSWYLEAIKPAHGEKMAEQTKQNTLHLFSQICSMLHPFMPFITEEIWNVLTEGKVQYDCIVSPYPQPEGYDELFISKVEQAKDIITGVREIRNKNGIKMKDPLTLVMTESDKAKILFDLTGWKEFCIKLANLSSFDTVTALPAGFTFISDTEQLCVVSEERLDVESELKEKETELNYQIGFVRSVEAKLSNERFVNGAPSAVVEKERQKLRDGNERIRILTEDIERLKQLRK